MSKGKDDGEKEGREKNIARGTNKRFKKKNVIFLLSETRNEKRGNIIGAAIPLVFKTLI